MNIKLTSFSIFLILLFVLVISYICWNCFIIEGFPRVASQAEVQASDAASNQAVADSKLATLVSKGIQPSSGTVLADSSVGDSTITLDNPNLKPGDVVVINGVNYYISSFAL